MAGYFSKESLKFIADLKKHNDREWFKANKDRYEEEVRQPFLDFISDAGPQLKKISPYIVADPRPVGGSLFRIHRDVRFSKDKSPYKTHAGAHFRANAGKDVHSPGYYLHIEPSGCFIAGGMWMPDSKGLRMIRDGIADNPDHWRKIRKVLDSEDRLIRPPQGFDPTHPLIEDIKLKSFTASVRLTDAQVTSPHLMKTFIEGCKTIAPLMKFLANSVGQPW